MSRPKTTPPDGPASDTPEASPPPEPADAPAPAPEAPPTEAAAEPSTPATRASRRRSSGPRTPRPSRRKSREVKAAEPAPPPASSAPAEPVSVPVPVPVPVPAPEPPSPPAPASLSDPTFSPDAGASESFAGDDFLLEDETIGVRLNRRWERAKTDLYELGEELAVQYRRLDLFVIVAGLTIAAVASYVHRQLVSPATVEVAEHGLTFRRTTAWLAPDPVTPPTPRLVRAGPAVKKKPGDLPYHVIYTSSLDPDARLEVLVDERPPWSNILTSLELDRRTRFGELYHADPGQVRSIAGHDWLRTPYRYAYATEKGDEPLIGHAVEYATVDRERLYAVTFHGTHDQIARIEDDVAPSLRVESHTGMPLLPQVGRRANRGTPKAIAGAFPSTVMVVVADTVDGRLRARGGGSGIVVGRDGSVITNYHVVHDKDGRLHELFILGRFVGEGRPPELVCAGRPNRSKLQPELDLALLKCDLDLDGQPWMPTGGGPWPVIPMDRPEPVRPGQRLWVIGYPDVGGGGITLSQGLVEGWTGEDGGLGRDYLKTDASITHGNSGGPVVDDQGKLVGMATAFRIRISASGGVIETAKVGLVRPMSAASELLAIARAGWLPREGHTAVELEPTAIEAPPEGIRISTRVVDAANDQPVANALLMVLRPGIGTADIDMNRLDDLVLAWGRSNTDGDVQLKQPVPAPGTYSVLVMARGYDPLVGDNELRLPEDAPSFFDPWGVVRIESQ